MGTQYSVEVCKQLEERFRAAEVHRPMRITRHEPGTELTYRVRGVGGNSEATVRLAIERFVGGGFAGQVYQVRIVQVEGDSVPGVEAGAICAMKILIPPSGFSCLFRNLLYWIGFQGPFQLQVNPAAARAGALWQKFIRRGAKLKFGDEQAVVDIFREMAEAPVSEEELAKARVLLESGDLRMVETAEGQAFHNGYWNMIGGEEFANEYLDRVDEVTAEDVREAAALYFGSGVHVTALVGPE